MAADVAVRDPLPGRVTVLRELRAVGASEGMTPPAGTRLVDLAAAMARGRRCLSAPELYPLDLDLDLALRISKAAVELEEALDQAGFPLAYDQQRKRFLPRAREVVARHTERTVSALTSLSVTPQVRHGIRLVERLGPDPPA